MALCRCEKLHANPIGRVKHYVRSIEPVGYPDTSSICGIPRCENPGLIWLTGAESIQYDQGQRIFNGPNNFTKMKAKDPV
jgi:hypothetical protein